VASRTLNARLGIEGGISILGTTGIVIPMSTDAWRATVDAGLDVAQAGGVERVVLSHGRSSEAAAQVLFAGELPAEAFVLMGDHVGYALEGAADRRLGIVLAGQFAKFCKVAAGHFATHVKDSALDLGVLARLLREAGFPAADAERALNANTAREVFQRLAREGDRGVFRALTEMVAERASQRIGERVGVAAVLFGYDKAPLARHGA
jgi:cobalt-precorrin-5B (C1)-methyltransferase